MTNPTMDTTDQTNTAGRMLDSTRLRNNDDDLTQKTDDRTNRADATDESFPHWLF